MGRESIYRKHHFPSSYPAIKPANPFLYVRASYLGLMIVPLNNLKILDIKSSSLKRIRSLSGSNNLN